MSQQNITPPITDKIEGDQLSAEEFNSVKNTVDANATDAQTQIDSKADISHTHTIGDVTDLQTELDGKESALTQASQAEMEAGSETSIRSMSPENIKQAIDANAADAGQAPTITSSLTQSISQGGTVSYELIADKGVSYEWDFTNTPDVQTLNGNMRKITGGSGLSAGVYNIPVSAINYYGTDTQVLELSVGQSSTEVDLFLMAGQSNMLGWADSTTLNTSPDQTTQDALYYVSWHDTVSNAETTQYYSDVASQTVAGYTVGLSGQSTLIQNPKFGPEIGFAARANEIGMTTNQLALMKYAVDQSGLTEALSSPAAISDWDTIVPGTRIGDCWRGFQSAITDAISKYEAAGYTVNLKGMVWWQGENGTDAANLNTFIAAVRNYLGTNHGLANSSQFPVVIAGQTPGWGDGLEAGVADIDPFVGYVETSLYQTNFGGFYNLHPGSGDNVSTDTDSNGNNDIYDMGVLFADAMQPLLAASPWEPSELTSSYWWDASDASTITATSNVVDTWTDKNQSVAFLSGELGTDTGPVDNTVTFNGLQVLDFNNNRMQVAQVDDPLLTEYTKIIVFSRDVDSASNNLLSHATSGNDAVFGNNSKKVVIFQDDGFAISGQTDIDPLNDLNIVAVTGNATETTLNINGTADASSPGSGVTGTGNRGTNQRMEIGCFIGNANYLNGQIAEIILMPTVATTDERQKAEGYLAHKWGITSKLDAGHPYKSSVPTI